VKNVQIGHETLPKKSKTCASMISHVMAMFLLGLAKILPMTWLIMD